MYVFSHLLILPIHVPRSPNQFKSFLYLRKNIQLLIASQYVDSTSPFVSSSAGLAPPTHAGQKYIRKSISILSSAGSLLSASSSIDEESKEPKTPTLSDWPSAKGLPDDADVRLAISCQQPPTTKAQPEIHRAFSFELAPEAPLRPAPLPPLSQHTRNETAAKLAVGSSNTASCPSDFSTALECKATIAQLAKDFLPEYISTPQATLARKNISFPLLKIDTRGFHTPLGNNRISHLDVPEIKLLPTIDHDVEMLSLGYKAYSESRAEQDRTLLSFSERETLSSRHSITSPVPRRDIAYDDFRKGFTRYSAQTPSKRLLNDMHEQKLFIPTQYKPYSAPQPVLRRSVAEFELLMSLEQKAIPVIHSAPIKFIPYSAPEIKRKQMQLSAPEIYIPEDVPAPLFTKRTEPVAVAKPRDLFPTGDFVAKDQGLQLRMTRVVTTFAKLEWVVQDLSSVRRLKCFAPANSLSSRKGALTLLFKIAGSKLIAVDFFDVEDNPLFNFQKRIGNTRIATTPLGADVFSVHNASLPSLPQWTVKLASCDGIAVQWDAKGRGTETVVVRQAGVEVGRIRCESGHRSHSVSFSSCLNMVWVHSEVMANGKQYIVSIAKGENYAVMAALATVFDDLRTDEGW